MTIENLDNEYEDKEEDRYYFEMQARLGSEEEKKSAYDKNGEFHCIHWFDCSYCPAFNSEHCM